MEMFRSELHNHHNAGRKQRAEEESEKGHSDSSYNHTRHKPEDELECDRASHENAQSKAKMEVGYCNAISSKAKGCSSDSLSGLEACSGSSGGVPGGVEDAKQEGDDPAC